MHRRTSFLFVFALALALAAFLSPEAARADGAVAIGLPEDVVKDGLAIGYTINHLTAASAEAEALKQCQGFTGATPATRALCRVVQSFENQCIALSIDPQAGTPGWGVAVAPTQAEAERRATEDCHNTSPPERRSFCVLEPTRCDTR